MKLYIRNRARYSPKTKDTPLFSVNIHNFANTYIWQLKENLRKVSRIVKVDELFHFCPELGMRRLEDGRSVAHYRLQDGDILETTSNPFFVAAIYILWCDAEKKRNASENKKFQQLMDRSVTRKRTIMSVLFNCAKDNGDTQPQNFRSVDEFVAFIKNHPKKGTDMSHFTVTHLYDLYASYLERDAESADPIGSFVRRYAHNLGLDQEEEDAMFVIGPAEVIPPDHVIQPVVRGRVGHGLPAAPAGHVIQPVAYGRGGQYGGGGGHANHNVIQPLAHGRGGYLGVGNNRTVVQNPHDNVIHPVAHGRGGYLGIGNNGPLVQALPENALYGRGGGYGGIVNNRTLIQAVPENVVQPVARVRGGYFDTGNDHAVAQVPYDHVIQPVDRESGGHFVAEPVGHAVQHGKRLGTGNAHRVAAAPPGHVIQHGGGGHFGSGNAHDVAAPQAAVAPTTPTARVRARKQPEARACDNCVEGREAVAYCAECEDGMVFCQTCDAFIHQGATRRRHVRLDVAEAPKPSKGYTPHAYRAPFAMLLALYSGHLKRPMVLSFTEDELKERGQKLTDTDLSDRTKKFVGGFDAVDGLITKDLVRREGTERPTYALTERGVLLSRRLRVFHNSLLSLAARSDVAGLPDVQGQDNFMVGTRRLCLVIDTQEKQIPRLRALTAAAGLTSQVRDLPTGDYLWLLLPPGARPEYDRLLPQMELVLPSIVERKTWDDLNTSLRDGRFERQVAALKRSRQRDCFYLVEGSVSDMRSTKGTPAIKETLKETLLTLVADDHFHVVQTGSWLKTAEWLIRISHVMAELLKTASSRVLVTYETFTKRVKDKDAPDAVEPLKISCDVWGAERFVAAISSPNVLSDVKTSLDLPQYRDTKSRKLVILQGLEAYNKGRAKCLNDCLSIVCNQEHREPNEVVTTCLGSQLHKLVHHEVHAYYISLMQIALGLTFYRTESVAESDAVSDRFLRGRYLATHELRMRTDPVAGPSKVPEAETLTKVKVTSEDFAPDSQSEEDMMRRALELSQVEAKKPLPDQVRPPERPLAGVPGSPESQDEDLKEALRLSVLEAAPPSDRTGSRTQHMPLPRADKIDATANNPDTPDDELQEALRLSVLEAAPPSDRPGSRTQNMPLPRADTIDPTANNPATPDDELQEALRLSVLEAAPPSDRPGSRTQHIPLPRADKIAPTTNNPATPDDELQEALRVSVLEAAPPSDRPGSRTQHIPLPRADKIDPTANNPATPDDELQEALRLSVLDTRHRDASATETLTGCGEYPGVGLPSGSDPGVEHEVRPVVDLPESPESQDEDLKEALRRSVLGSPPAGPGAEIQGGAGSEDSPILVPPADNSDPDGNSRASPESQEEDLERALRRSILDMTETEKPSGDGESETRSRSLERPNCAVSGAIPLAVVPSSESELSGDKEYNPESGRANPEGLEVLEETVPVVNKSLGDCPDCDDGDPREAIQPSVGETTPKPLGDLVSDSRSRTPKRSYSTSSNGSARTGVTESTDSQDEDLWEALRRSAVDAGVTGQSGAWAAGSGSRSPSNPDSVTSGKCTIEPPVEDRGGSSGHPVESTTDAPSHRAAVPDTQEGSPGAGDVRSGTCMPDYGNSPDSGVETSLVLDVGGSPESQDDDIREALRRSVLDTPLAELSGSDHDGLESGLRRDPDDEYPDPGAVVPGGSAPASVDDSGIPGFVLDPDFLEEQKKLLEELQLSKSANKSGLRVISPLLAESMPQWTLAGVCKPKRSKNVQNDENEIWSINDLASRDVRVAAADQSQEDDILARSLAGSRDANIAVNAQEEEDASLARSLPAARYSNHVTPYSDDVTITGQTSALEADEELARRLQAEEAALFSKEDRPALAVSPREAPLYFSPLKRRLDPMAAFPSPTKRPRVAPSCTITRDSDLGHAGAGPGFLDHRAAPAGWGPGTAGMGAGKTVPRYGESARAASADHYGDEQPSQLDVYRSEQRHRFHGDKPPAASATVTRVATVIPTVKRRPGNVAAQDRVAEAVYVVSDDEEDKIPGGREEKGNAKVSRCGLCKAKGHTRISKLCPFYYSEAEMQKRATASEKRKEKREAEKRSQAEILTRMTQQRNLLQGSLDNMQNQLQDLNGVVQQIERKQRTRQRRQQRGDDGAAN